MIPSDGPPVRVTTEGADSVESTQSAQENRLTQDITDETQLIATEVAEGKSEDEATNELAGYIAGAYETVTGRTLTEEQRQYVDRETTKLIRETAPEAAVDAAVSVAVKRMVEQLLFGTDAGESTVAGQ